MICQPYDSCQTLYGSFEMSSRYNVFTDEFRSLVRFCFVGLIATAVHMSVALTLVIIFGTAAQAANIFAFAVALGVSYFGHYCFSFKSTREHRVAIAKFFIVAAGAFICNLLIVELLTTQKLLGGNLPLILGISVMPLISFVISRLWVF